MALFTAPGPNGETLQIDAPNEAAAAQALQEMVQGGGGQNTMRGGGLFDDLPTREETRGQAAAPAPPSGGTPSSGGMFDDVGISKRDQFGAAFDPSRDSAATAEGLDQRVNGEADDRGRWATAGNALTMGFGDEVMGLLAGGLTFAQGKGFDEGYDKMTNAIRGDIGQYSERHPVESTAIDIAGSLPTAMIPGGAAVRGASLGAKVARGAIAGAGYGGVRGFGEGEGGVDNRLESAKEGAKFGGAVGGAVPIIGNAVGKVAGRVMGRNLAPSVQQLDDAASALYQRADNAGVAVQPSAIVRVNTILPQRIAKEGFDPQLHPNAARALNRISEMTQSGGPLSLGEIENTRRVIRQAISASSGPDKKADRLMSGRILDQFDAWMGGLQPRDMLAAGPVSGREAIGILQEARALWSRKSKGDVLADMVERAQLDDNFENGLRREFRTLARNNERMRPFTAGEKEAIRKVAKGGDMGWITRALGSFSPTTLGGAVKSAAVSGIGVATGNPAAAILPVIGYGAKKISDAATRRGANIAGAAVRSGGSVPVSPKGKVVGDYATRLIGAAGQAVVPEFLPSGP